MVKWVITDNLCIIGAAFNTWPILGHLFSDFLLHSFSTATCIYIIHRFLFLSLTVLFYSTIIYIVSRFLAFSYTQNNFNCSLLLQSLSFPWEIWAELKCVSAATNIDKWSHGSFSLLQLLSSPTLFSWLKVLAHFYSPFSWSIFIVKN